MSAETTKKAKVGGIFLFKEGMSTVYNENGVAVPVTVLRYEPWVVTQVKTIQNDGYNAIQFASGKKPLVASNKAEVGHMKKAGLETGAKLVRELRVDDVSGIELGSVLSLDSIAAGDSVCLVATSKGKGFAGSVRRFGFAGGPASHGSKFHRRPGSSGNRTWPGRVMPGKRFPGHLGAKRVSLKNVSVVHVNPEEGVVFVKGGVPGARNSLVTLVKE